METLMRGSVTSLGNGETLPGLMELGPDFAVRSTFNCPVDKVQATAENPPTALPCGHLVGKVRATVNITIAQLTPNSRPTHQKTTTTPDPKKITPRIGKDCVDRSRLIRAWSSTRWKLGMLILCFSLETSCFWCNNGKTIAFESCCDSLAEVNHSLGFQWHLLWQAIINTHWWIQVCKISCDLHRPSMFCHGRILKLSWVLLNPSRYASWHITTILKTGQTSFVGQVLLSDEKEKMMFLTILAVWQTLAKFCSCISVLCRMPFTGSPTSTAHAASSAHTAQ